jgi:hypothetical protein
MKKAGVLLIVLGIVSVFLAFNMDVVVGISYNIGLLNERQNIVYLSGILFLAGIILFGFGVVAKEKSENLKAFTLWAVLTPIVLLLTIKIVSDIQAEQAAIKAEETKQAEIEAWLAKQAEQVAQEAERAELRKVHEAERAALLKEENSDIFIDNKNGTVTFKVSGLTWQKCSFGQTWNGETCSGEATKMNWDDAAKLSNSFAGYAGWRLPTKVELMTLIFCTDGEYGEDGSCKNSYDVTHPTINPTYFPNTEVSAYWSSSLYATNNNDAWTVSFYSSGAYYDYKNSSNFVRLVH